MIHLQQDHIWSYIRLGALLCLLGAGLLVPLKGQLLTTVAGTVETPGDVDGAALEQALFNNPHGIAADKYGRVYIADRWNHKVRVLDTRTDTVYTLAGTGQIGADNGPGATARFHSPWGIACDSVGNVYVADTKNYLIRKIDTMGVVSTYAGSGSFGVMDGPVANARFADPTGITISPNGTIYVADHVAHTIRSIAPNGLVTTLAGKAFIEGDTDGVGIQARFYRPYGIELSPDGDIIVADEWNHKIRRVSPTGLTTTIAGSGLLGSDDGVSSQARFNFPWDVTIDTAGAIYVMDGYNHVLRKIARDTVETYVGEAGTVGGQDGYGINGSFSGATTLAYSVYDHSIYIGDAFNDLIRKVEESPGIGISAPPYASGDTICVGTELLFTAIPRLYTSYEFFLNETSLQIGADSNFVTIFNTPGTYTLYVDAINETGFQVASKPFVLHVVDKPAGSFSYTVEETLDGFDVDFTYTGSGATQWEWDFGDTLSGFANFSTLENPEHLYQELGTYDITLISTGAGGCADTLFSPGAVAFLGIVPDMAGLASGDSVCTGSLITFSSNTELYTRYDFYVNDAQVQSSTNTSYSHFFADDSPFIIRVEGLTDEGKLVRSPDFEVVAIPTPVADFTFDLLGRGPAGYGVSFEASPPDAAFYQWDFGDPASGSENMSTLLAPTHIYTTPGVYSISLIVSGQAGCSDTLSRPDHITLLGLLADNLEDGDTVCVGHQATFSSNSTEFATYEFSLNGILVQRSNQSSLSRIFDQPGTYLIGLKGEKTDGEIVEAPGFSFLVAEVPEAIFNFTEGDLTPDGLSVDFLALGSAASYIWDFGAASDESDRAYTAEATYTYQQFGNYPVILIASNGGLCADTLIQPDLIVFEDKPANLFIPTAFSPNNDGNNDVLRVRGQFIVAATLQVYNEWGELIFNGDGMEGWNGQYRGKIVQPDTYVYLARITLANGTVSTLQGKTTVIR